MAGRSSQPRGFSREGEGLEDPGSHLGGQVSLPSLTDFLLFRVLLGLGQELLLCLQHLLWAAAGRIFVQKLAVQIQKAFAPLEFPQQNDSEV